MISDAANCYSRTDLFIAAIEDCEDLIIEENEGKVLIEWTEPRYVEILDGHESALQKVVHVFRQSKLKETVDYTLNISVKTGYRGPDWKIIKIQTQNGEATELFFKKLTEKKAEKEPDGQRLSQMLMDLVLESEQTDF